MSIHEKMQALAKYKNRIRQLATEAQVVDWETHSALVELAGWLSKRLQVLGELAGRRGEHAESR